MEGKLSFPLIAILKNLFLKKAQQYVQKIKGDRGKAKSETLEEGDIEPDVSKALFFLYIS